MDQSFFALKRQDIEELSVPIHDQHLLAAAY